MVAGDHKPVARPQGLPGSDRGSAARQHGERSEERRVGKEC